MEAKNVIIEKALKENYLNIQKEEFEVGENSEMLVIDFSKNTADLVANFKAEQKEVSIQKKDIKALYKSNLEKIKIEHEKHLDALVKSASEVEESYVKEIEQIETLNVQENTKLNKEIEKLEKDYLKLIAKVKKEYESNISKSNKAKEKINSEAEANIELLHKKFIEDKEEHETNIASISSNKSQKIAELTKTIHKNIEKALEDITNEENRMPKAFEDAKAETEQKITNIEKMITDEKEAFESKYEGIKSTLDSKVARHEKFMNKSIIDNDQRAAKQHKKEIGILQKNAEKELKLLESEYYDKLKINEAERKVLNHENLELFSTFSKKLIEFKEDKLYQIDCFKANLDSELKLLNLDIDAKLQEEMLKLDEIEKDKFIALASIMQKQEIELEKETDIQVKLEAAFNKENDLNKVKHEEALATINKEIKVLESNKELSLKTSELNKSIALSKIDYDTKVSDKKVLFDIKVNEESEIMEYYNLDFTGQKDMSKHNLLFQIATKKLFESREDFVLTYEEQEVINRTPLKIDFLNNQLQILEKDKDVFIENIHISFEAQHIQYEDQKEIASSKELEELRIYEEEASVAITKMIEERDALDKEANKEEIKALNVKIKKSRKDLDKHIKTKKESIASNSELFDKLIIEVDERRDLSIKQAEDFFDQELLRIHKLIDLVQKNNDEELNDAKEYQLKIFDKATLLLQTAHLRDNKLVDEKNIFKENRIPSENDAIKNFKDIFMKQKNEIKESSDKVISVFEKEIKSEESRHNDLVSKEESELQKLVASFNKQIKEIEKNEMSILNKQASTFKDNCSKIEKDAASKIKTANSEFSSKESLHKGNISKIEKVRNVESKKIEGSKKTIRKQHASALTKKLKELDIKLQQDIKEL